MSRVVVTLRYVPRHRLAVSALALALTLAVQGACSSGTWYYLESTLNKLSVGASKDSLLTAFRGGEVNGHQTSGMQIRAAKRTDSGDLLEVGQLVLMDETNKERKVPYWFLFKNGKLVQWGRPEDWRAVAARYEIDFNPRIGVRE